MIEPGDVVVAFLAGARESKRRPAIVVSTDPYHAARPDVLSAIVTGQTASSNSDFDFLLRDWQTAGLRVPSAMRCYLFTVEQIDVTRIGRLSSRDWSEVQARLRLALDV